MIGNPQVPAGAAGLGLRRWRHLTTWAVGLLAETQLGLILNDHWQWCRDHLTTGIGGRRFQGCETLPHARSAFLITSHPTAQRQQGKLTANSRHNVWQNEPTPSNRISILCHLYRSIHPRPDRLEPMGNANSPEHVSSSSSARNHPRLHRQRIRLSPLSHLARAPSSACKRRGQPNPFC